MTCLLCSVLFGEVHMADCFQNPVLWSVCKFNKISEIPGESKILPRNTTKKIGTSNIIFQKN